MAISPGHQSGHPAVPPETQASPPPDGDAVDLLAVGDASQQGQQGSTNVEPPSLPPPPPRPLSQPSESSSPQPPLPALSAPPSQSPQLSPIQAVASLASEGLSRNTTRRSRTDSSTTTADPPAPADAGTSVTSPMLRPRADRGPSPSWGGLRRRIQGSIDPSSHELLEKRPTEDPTTREYRRDVQRRRLLRLTIGEWCNTLALCLTYFGILYAYAQMDTISVPQRRVFNALTTGNSLLLGVNLAASLRSYAKLLRWRMLAHSPRSLETFDLIMGCDSLLNVGRLLLRATNRRNKWLPSRTQLLALVWLLIHLAITLLVGIIGLNYNLDVSGDFVLTRNGLVSIVDLESLSTGTYLFDLSAVQLWGVRGLVTDELQPSEPNEYKNSYYSSGDGNSLYYFQDSNANDTSQTGVTSRYIESHVVCEGHQVIQGQYGNLSHVIYNDGQRVVNQSLPEPPGPAGLLVISMLNSTCGDRCVEIKAFQAQNAPTDDVDGLYDLADGRIFLCNSTVPQVEDDAHALEPAYLISPLISRMLAGAVGWSDDPPVLNGTAESQVYTNASHFGFFTTPNETDMADAISDLTMGAIAFMDASPTMDRKVVANGKQPISAQILHVTWRYAGTILAIIPFIHFWALVTVVAWANRAIIKDDSHLAIAKVYQSILRPLGDHGCLLQGHEIVRALDNPQVVYGWTSSDEPPMKHVDVFEDGQMPAARIESRFEEGWFDGLSACQ